MPGRASRGCLEMPSRMICAGAPLQALLSSLAGGSGVKGVLFSQHREQTAVISKQAQNRLPWS
jgi:hypothetical protein